MDGRQASDNHKGYTLSTKKRRKLLQRVMQDKQKKNDMYDMFKLRQEYFEAKQKLIKVQRRGSQLTVKPKPKKSALDVKFVRVEEDGDAKVQVTS